MAFEKFLKERASGFPAPIYLLSYTQAFFLTQAIMVLKEAQAELDVFDLDDKSQSTSMKTVIETLNQTSMFCPRPCVIIKNYQKIKKADQGLLDRYIENPSDRSILVLFYSGELKKVDTKGIKRIDLDLNRSALPIWVQERVGHYGIRLSAELINYVCEIYAEDLTALDNELNKLSLYGRKELSLEDACEVFYGTRQYTPFQFTRAIAEANIGKALTIFRGLEEHTETFTLMGAINWEISKLNLPVATAVKCYKLLSDADIQVRINPDYPVEVLITSLCSALKRNKKPPA
ncbi:MAG: hypothetical protein HQL06_01885 [Nitrospirae bacterium]|nr:hypothetical protein [Nitrospirota bacterium]